MSKENAGVHPSLARHLVRYHAWGDVVMEGLKRMAESGTSPKEVLEDTTGVKYHEWDHGRNPDKSGGSPSHIHTQMRRRRS
jgi:hypothetical protein